MGKGLAGTVKTAVVKASVLTYYYEAKAKLQFVYTLTGIVDPLFLR